MGADPRRAIKKGLQVQQLGPSSTWMSQELVRINGLFHLLINGVYWGYNPLINLLLISWDIEILKDGVYIKKTTIHLADQYKPSKFLKSPSPNFHSLNGCWLRLVVIIGWASTEDSEYVNLHKPKHSMHGIGYLHLVYCSW